MDDWAHSQGCQPDPGARPQQQRSSGQGLGCHLEVVHPVGGAEEAEAGNDPLPQQQPSDGIADAADRGHQPNGEEAEDQHEESQDHGIGQQPEPAQERHSGEQRDHRQRHHQRRRSHHKTTQHPRPPIGRPLAWYMIVDDRSGIVTA
jgi:hypothetical protein